MIVKPLICGCGNHSFQVMCNETDIVELVCLNCNKRHNPMMKVKDEPPISNDDPMWAKDAKPKEKPKRKKKK